MKYFLDPAMFRARSPETLLLLLMIAMPLSMSSWMVLINNFTVERAGFNGADIGVLQSVREIPGFLSFAFIFTLLIWREQTVLMIFLILLGLGTAATGFFPSYTGLMITTVIMSLGFHYYEAAAQSLTLQWIDKDRTAALLGGLLSAGSLASLVAFALVWLAFDLAGLDYAWTFALVGALTVAIGIYAWLAFPHFKPKVEQRRSLVLRRRYWLYYALTFMGGARRQIFVVFAVFMLVERFGYGVGSITLLFMLNHLINIFLAPYVGRLIGRVGERPALIFEYVGLIAVFTAYAFVSNATVAAGLFIVDHLFFALAIAMKTYFQKIADPADVAPSTGVSYTINHIAAVVIPAAFGLIWLYSPALVFLAGAAMAGVSLLLSLLVPSVPAPGNETTLSRPAAAAGAAS
ncbi:MAG: MFS transporter [Alphaproteobacteria bacterium]